MEKKIMDLKQAQEKLVRSAGLAVGDELASKVRHELRNPLNVIKNCVFLLNLTIDGKADEETLKILRLVDQQVEILNRVITNLLDFTRAK